MERIEHFPDAVWESRFTVLDLEEAVRLERLEVDLGGGRNGNHYRFGQFFD
jgi:hypothetical protein